MPKEPPTLPVSTRTWSVGRFMMVARVARCPKTPWQPTRRVRRPSSTVAMAERGSIAATTMRLLRSVRRVVWAARAKAAVNGGGVAEVEV